MLLFREYDFIVVYKLGKIYVVIDALSRLLDIIEPTSVPIQTTNASLFYTKPEWLMDVKEFYTKPEWLMDVKEFSKTG